MKRVAAVKRARRRGRAPTRGVGGTLQAFSGRIVSAADDALETVADGSITLAEQGAFGLQSVTDDEVITGLRWSLPLESGATVEHASVRFTARGNNGDAFTVRIRAQAADAGAAFASATSNISARATTTAFVDWLIPAWATGQNDEGTRTPDLSSVIQEVVNRAGFSGPIVLIAERAPTTPTGRRRFLSYDDDPTNAPLLVINDPVAPPPPPPPPPSELEFNLRGDPTFNKSSLSGQAATDYDTLLAEIANSSNKSQIEGLAGNGDLFWKSRTVHTHITALMVAFRITKDLTLLDSINALADIIYADLETGWDPATSGESGYDTWSGFRMWRHYYGVNQGHSAWGKDILINDAKIHALVAEIARALDTNRDLTSPAKGVTYAADADKWKAYLLTDNDGFLAKIAEGRHGEGSNYSFSPFRPHSDNHSWTSTIKLWYHLWKLTGDSNWKAQADRAADILWTHPVSGGPQNVDHPEYRTTPGVDGDALVWMSNVHWASTSRNYLQSTPYSTSVFPDAVTFHMEGYREWANEDTMRQLARSVRSFHFLTSSGAAYSSPSDVLSDGIAGDVGGGSPDFKPTRAGIPHDERSDRPLRRSAESVSQYSMGLIAAWDASGYVEDVYRAVRDAFIGESENTTRVSAGLFVDSFLKGL